MNECKKEKNRFFILFIIVFAFTFLIYRGTVFAATVYTEGDFYYELQDESIVITGYFGTDTEITLPDKIAGYPVSKIAQGAFTDTDTVKTINLPDTIMEIEEGAIALKINVVYMSNADTFKQSEPDSPDSAEREEAGKDDDEKTDNEMNEEDNKENVREETIGIEATAAEETEAGNVEEEEINPLDTLEKENNEYTMATNQDGTVTIQSQNGEEVSSDSDEMIKAGEKAITKTDKDGNVKNLGPKNVTWIVIIAILIVLGIIGMAAVIVCKMKSFEKKKK